MPRIEGISVEPMASGIVKWWRAKFHGGYKQMTVLSGDCGATDTEELICHRAPSVCSAPPDLLPRNEPLSFADNAAFASATPQRRPDRDRMDRDRAERNRTDRDRADRDRMDRLRPQQQASPVVTQQQHTTNNAPTHGVNNNNNNNNNSNNNNNNNNSRVHFEEFTCDVSIEGGEDSTGVNTSQPLQFSFTLYDLDGHGRITKDDIAGIVSTIYESVRKSVIVPHYGSKTIKVRLTVAPEQKIPATAKLINNTSSSRLAARREPGFLRRKPRRRKTVPTAPIHSEPVSEEEQCSGLFDDEVASDSDGQKGQSRRPRFNSKQHTKRPPSQATECTLLTSGKHVLRGRSLSAGSGPEQRGYWRRSGSLQRRELLEIIQASMEKNNLCFQTNRKTNNEERSNVKHHRNRANTLSKSFEPQESKFCRYDSFLHSVICSQQQNVPSQTKPNVITQTTPQRSRSHELGQTNPAIRYTLLEPSDVSYCKMDLRKNLQKKHNHVCSHHHLKHQNREKYHARAMAQVERWLENDNATRLASKQKKTQQACVDPIDSQECEGLLKTTDKINDSLEDKSSSPSNSTIHRYVHEHIHHHYHHFEEEASAAC